MIVKVCGMRDAKNIKALLELPIDLMGLIFYKKSSRNILDSQATEIVAASGDKVKRVGVFVDEDLDKVIQKVEKFKLTYVQLHGKETPDYCYDLLAKSAKTYGCCDELQLIKAFSVDEQFDFSITKGYRAYCKYFIFDTKGKNAGGNGFMFDWNLLKQYKGTTPFLLSGGIDAQSAEAIKALNFPQLAGIDLNSKFEKSPAMKNIDLLKGFLTEINSVSV